MQYIITPYAYRKIRETIKQSQKVIKCLEPSQLKYPESFDHERVKIKLTIIKQR